MSSYQSSTPQLPVFGIRNLTGPENVPGLISITSREYDSTIQSEPSAKLLYLDDDDGELITVGSALELSQRLEEPIPRYSQTNFSGTRNPLDGKLVHVFDINRTPGSLIAWTDHEAYSSKKLRRPVSSPQLSTSPFADPVESVATLPSDASDLPRQDISSDREVSASTQDLPPQEKQKLNSVDTQAKTILDGIEEHLSGLANVLQVAATTLQKAADKTGDADTSVVEDILRGVKNILTEVGSFGLEAYKAFENEPSEALSWLSPTENESLVPENAQDQIPSDVSVSEPEDLALDESERSPTRPIMITDNRPSPRVKFAATVIDVVEEADDLAESPVSSTLDEDAESFSEKRKRDEMRECERIVPITNPSILDDGNEDADFTARYPPLMSIRRAHTVSGLCGRDHVRGPRRNERDSQPLPHKPLGHQDIFSHHSQSVDKAENVEPLSKPIPGAWPHQNEYTSALPPSGESSGAFFNRMTGRDRIRDMSSLGLHRANTTAASNPASRLNGPFDPVSVYQSSDPRSFEAPFRPRRSLVNSNRVRYQPPWARSSQDNPSPTDVNAQKGSIKEEAEVNLRSKRSLPAMHYNPPSEFDENSSNNATSNNQPINSTSAEFQRTVKHHRSVPQLQTMPSQSSTNIPVGNFGPRPQPGLDLLTGPIPLGLVASIPRSPEPQQAAPSFQNSILNTPLQRANSLADSTQSQSQPQSQFHSRQPGRQYHSHSFSGRSSQTPTFNASAAPFHPSTTNSQSQAEEGRSSSNFQWNYQTPPPQPFRYTPSRQTKPTRPSKNDFDQCVDQLKTLGFGANDSMVRDRLHVYAVAANGDVNEAVEMIEEDRRVSANFC